MSLTCLCWWRYYGWTITIMNMWCECIFGTLNGKVYIFISKWGLLVFLLFGNMQHMYVLVITRYFVNVWYTNLRVRLVRDKGPNEWYTGQINNMWTLLYHWYSMKLPSYIFHRARLWSHKTPVDRYITDTVNWPHMSPIGMKYRPSKYDLSWPCSWSSLNGNRVNKWWLARINFYYSVVVH